MRWSLAIGLLLIAGMLVRPAHACTCLPNPPPHEALAAATGVFAAEVIDLEHIDNTYPSDLRVTLRLIRIFKGDYGETVEVRTARDGASCGFPFRRGESYFVYIHNDGGGNDGGSPRVSLCSRTAALADADEDLAAFDAEDLEETAGARSAVRRCGGPTNAAALQGLLFVVLLAGWQRRRRA